MSRNLKEAKLSVISEINKILKDNNYPALPIDKTPIQGDISVICFPGARILNTSPEDVANNVSRMVTCIKLVKESYVAKAFCNLVLDWDVILEDVIADLNFDEYGRGDLKPDTILVEHTSANACLLYTSPSPRD